MPVPSTVNDLDPTASNNSPGGSEPIGPNLDGYLRAHAAIIRQVSDASNVGTQTHAATNKATPVDADELPLADSAASFGLKKLSWANLKVAIKTYLQAGMTMNGTLTLAADPVNPLEPATKQYADNNSGASVQGAHKNLQASATGTSTTVTETVDEIVVGNGSGKYKTLRNVSLSGALTTSGVNGLDNQAPQTVAITIASPGVVTLNGHGFPINAAVVLATSGALPTGLTAGTTYYVTNPTTNTFQLSATQGGAAINTSGSQSGTHTVASVLAANCWYSKWEVWNGTTVAIKFSSSATAPVLDAGYTHKARTGWVRTDGTANKYPLIFKQVGRKVRWGVAAGSNLTALRVMASGTAGSIGPLSWVAIGVSAFASPTAASMNLTVLNTNSASAVTLVSPNNGISGSPSTATPTSVPLYSWYGVGNGGNYGLHSGPIELMLESDNIYWISTNANSGIVAIGWEDNL